MWDVVTALFTAFGELQSGDCFHTDKLQYERCIVAADRWDRSLVRSFGRSLGQYFIMH